MGYQRSITLTDHRGIKVRTATGYRYYVVIPNGDSKAKVIRRSHSAVPIVREMSRWDHALTYEVTTRDGVAEGIRIPLDSLERRGAAEKRAEKARKTEVARFGRGY